MLMLILKCDDMEEEEGDSPDSSSFRQAFIQWSVSK